MPIAPEAEEIAGPMLNSIGEYHRKLGVTSRTPIIGDFPQELPRRFLKGTELISWDATRGNGTVVFRPKVGMIPNTAPKMMPTPAGSYVSPGLGFMMAGSAIGEAWQYYRENAIVRPREASEIQEDLVILIAATAAVATRILPQADSAGARIRTLTRTKTATKTASRRVKIHGVTRA